MVLNSASVQTKEPRTDQPWLALAACMIMEWEVFEQNFLCSSYCQPPVACCPYEALGILPCHIVGNASPPSLSYFADEL